ncbi:hypothetical protein Bca101_036734 [Brassica carinata]
MFLTQTVPRNFSALSHLLHVCLATTLMQLVSSRIYRVEMSIADETGEALFVCFGGVMTKLHNMKAYGTGLLLAPPFVSDMVGFLNERDREPQPAFVDNGGDDDNGDDNPGAVSVPAKVEAGGSSQAEGASDMVKKARKA